MRLFTALCFDEDTKSALFLAEKAAEKEGNGNFKFKRRKFNFRKGGYDLFRSFRFTDENKGEMKVFLRGKIPFGRNFRRFSGGKKGVFCFFIKT